MQEQIDGFLAHLAAREDASDNTVAAYRNDLHQLAAFLAGYRSPFGEKLSDWRQVDSSVIQALGAYRLSRDRCHGADPDVPFFVSQTGAALPKRTVESVFRHIQSQLDWQARGDYPVPRIHDLRHTFAVRRLQCWREQGQSIDHALFWLCTYLGHAKISDTYWYLTGVQELMDSIGTRFERFAALGASS